ncbi:hypothetical protein Moror_2843 [Moniliophthora roreri MCA 2997]|uniref:Uncharacterized protein n=2 Tax=Moniliophthora roreri TaxID=221103 RepID=V2YHV7_MONRO|nr:hypothetical protein Moror_2843 [Moniliophthora roreri MCA 2997]
MTGGNSDHSEDQKKLFKLLKAYKEKVGYEQQGESTLLDMTLEEALPLLMEIYWDAVDKAGGFTAWLGLTHNEQKLQNDNAYLEFCKRLGKERFNLLSEKERAASKLFLWVGCGMHKEMNAFKGAVQSIEEWWKENEREKPPCKLMNRDNRAAAESGSSEAATRAVAVSKGGAIKLTELAGAVFHHKDKRKGQQNTVKYFAQHVLGMPIVFPDTSNIRYHCHGDASSELLVNYDFYFMLLEMVWDKKEAGTFTNLELNVYTGLQDTPTIEELCAISLYSQSVTHPYLHTIREPEGNKTNALDLGPLHNRLISFIQKIINNPNILLSPAASFETATFDGKNWQRPEVIYAIQTQLPNLPHVRPLTIACFHGALTTWKRFLVEFAPRGEIDKATAN